MEKERIVFFNNKKQKLVGYLLRNSSKKLIIMCHGTAIFEEIPGIDKVFDFYFSLGRSVCYFHFTGYGDSEGRKSVSIAQRVDDIGSVLEQIGNQYDEILLYGVSLGAIAVAIGASKYKRISNVILINGIYSFDKYLSLRMKFTVYSYLLFHPKAKKEIDFSKRNFQPEKIKIPVLVVYGEKDTIVNPKNSLDLYNRLTSKKELVMVPNGDHSLMGKKYAPYLGRVIDWIAGMV